MGEVKKINNNDEIEKAPLDSLMDLLDDIYKDVKGMDPKDLQEIIDHLEDLKT